LDHDPHIGSNRGEGLLASAGSGTLRCAGLRIARLGGARTFRSAGSLETGKCVTKSS
jgi:hypothetical protein